jgi:hypothetical protein
VWIIVLIVVLMLCCCAAAVIGAGVGLIPWSWQSSWDFDLDDLNIPGVRAMATMEESFVVEGTPLLDVQCPVCDVLVNGGSGDTVEIEATKSAWSGSGSTAQRQLDRIDVQFVQEGDRIRVKVDMPQLSESGLGKRASVDLRITVPRRTDLDLDLDIGDVEIVGVEGAMDIRADVGRVELEEVVARDSLRVRTNVARIRFRGPLTEGVRYDMRSDVGDIALTLPADSSFEIEAESNVGDVACDFAVEGTQGRKDLVGERIEGTVGESPTAELVLRSEVGSIRISEE